ncbi:MAG: hypothetical protein EOP50_17765, partial [Sphingobacteriales bacterium]
TSHELVVFNANGTRDAAFDQVTGKVDFLAQQSNGKLVAHGFFFASNGLPARRLTRINTDGTLDTGFLFTDNTDYSIRSIAVLRNDHILLGGRFSAFNGLPRNQLVRLKPDGLVDSAYVPAYRALLAVNRMLELRSRKLMVVSLYPGPYNQHRNVLRLSENGGEDSLYNMGTGFNGTPLDLYVQSSGRIIAGGDFYAYNGHNVRGITAIHPDGTRDTSFNPGGVGTDLYVRTIAEQPDGKLLIGGKFTLYNGDTASCIARLHPDGRRDTSFRTGDRFRYNTSGAGVTSIVVQPDGKILVGGNFYEQVVTGHVNPARLLPDGSTDSTFHSAPYGVAAMALLPDGKIMIAGAQGVPGQGYAALRLHPDGTREFFGYNGAGELAWESRPYGTFPQTFLTV